MDFGSWVRALYGLDTDTVESFCSLCSWTGLIWCLTGATLVITYFVKVDEMDVHDYAYIYCRVMDKTGKKYCISLIIRGLTKHSCLIHNKHIFTVSLKTICTSFYSIVLLVNKHSC